MAGPRINVKGVRELNANLERLLKSVRPEQAESILQSAADLVAGEVRRRAPRGTTGNLKAAIVSKVLRRRDRARSAPGIVAINYRKAPHAHLVEYGHGGPHAAKRHPFFRPGWDASKRAAQAQIEEQVKRAIEGAV